MTFYQKTKGTAPRQPGATKFGPSSQQQQHQNHVQQEEQRMGGMGPEDNHSSAGFNGEVQLTMYIPAEMSGKVIGVKGIIISNITRETQCRFIKAMQPVGDSLWCAIVMMGDPERCLVAYQAIAKMVFHEVDDVVLTFYFNRKKHSFLTDLSGFHVIKRISAETQVGCSSCSSHDNTCSWWILVCSFWLLCTQSKSCIRLSLSIIINSPPMNPTPLIHPPSTYMFFLNPTSSLHFSSFTGSYICP